MSRRDGKKSQSQTTLGEAERASLIEDICDNVRNDFANAIATIVGPRLDWIEEKLNELSTLRATVSELENAVEHTSAQWTISSAQRYLPWPPDIVMIVQWSPAILRSLLAKPHVLDCVVANVHPLYATFKLSTTFNLRRSLRFLLSIAVEWNEYKWAILPDVYF